MVIYFIFPIGTYEIYWSPQVNDLYTDIVDSGEYYTWDDEESESQDVINSYKKGNLKGAIQSKNEIMMVTDEVVLIHRNYAEDVFKMMKDL